MLGHVLQPIEEIEVGQLVYSENPETGEKGLKKVVRTVVSETDELIYVSVDGQTIVTTPEHPFYVPVRGWIKAINLRASDILVTVNGEYKVVEEIQHEILETPVKVYNFEVEDFHTYYVSDLGVLVHNNCTDGTTSIKSNDVEYEQSSIDKAFSKHSQEFGNYPDGSKASLNQFKNDLSDFIDNPNNLQKSGTLMSWEGTHIYNPHTRQWVFVNANGTFNTAFKLSESQFQYLITTGAVK